MQPTHRYRQRISARQSLASSLVAVSESPACLPTKPSRCAACRGAPSAPVNTCLARSECRRVGKVGRLKDATVLARTLSLATRYRSARPSSPAPNRPASPSISSAESSSSCPLDHPDSGYSYAVVRWWACGHCERTGTDSNASTLLPICSSLWSENAPCSSLYMSCLMQASLSHHIGCFLCIPIGTSAQAVSWSYGCGWRSWNRKTMKT